MGNPKLDMLRNMMAGIPTPESQELSIKTTLYADEKNIGKFDKQTIQEMAYNMPLPDMAGVVIPNQALPMVSENDIMALMQGKLPQPQQRQNPIQAARQIMEHQQINEPAIDDYWGTSGGNVGRTQRHVSPDMERDSNAPFDVYEELKRKMAQKQKNTPAQRMIHEQSRPKNNQKSPKSGAGSDELEDMIEDIVYKVLAQIVNDAVKRKMGI